jgi:hypothetical protein
MEARNPTPPSMPVSLARRYNDSVVKPSSRCSVTTSGVSCQVTASTPSRACLGWVTGMVPVRAPSRTTLPNIDVVGDRQGYSLDDRRGGANNTVPSRSVGKAFVTDRENYPDGVPSLHEYLRQNPR